MLGVAENDRDSIKAGLQNSRVEGLQGCKSEADACSTSGPCGNAAPAYSGERFGGSNDHVCSLNSKVASDGR